MGALIRKELRSLVPYILLFMTLFTISVVTESVTATPHLSDVKELFEDYVTFSFENAGFTFVLYFALMAGLFNREYDDHTLEFLDGLPTTRLQIFCGKIVAAWVVVTLANLMDMGGGLLLLSLHDNSLLEAWDWSFISIAFLLRSVTGFVMVGWAGFFSLWRSFGWLIFALLVIVYLILSEAIPGLKVLNFIGLGANELATFDWHIRWGQMAGHVAFALLMYVMAYLLFAGITDQLNRLLELMREHAVGAVALVVLTSAMVIMLGVAGIAALSRDMEDELEEAPPARFSSWSTGKASTRYYDAVYLTDRADSARQLLDQADTIHEGVREFFGAEPGRKIFLDMSGTNRHAGVAFWNRVIIDLTESPEPDFLRAVLAHETAHVYLDRLSDSRLHSKLESTRFFHEGVASYVEWRVGDRAASRETYEQWAAAIHSRNPVRPEQLMTNSELTARFDTNIVYPLGQVFAAAIVDVYGDEAIPKLAQAFVRPGAPQSVSGLALWQDTFQACRMNLENVISRYQSMLDELVKQHETFIQSLPRLQGVVSQDSIGATIEVDAQAPEGWMIVCRTRRTEDSPDRTYQILTRANNGSFRVSRAEFDGGAGWYQLGLGNKEMVIYEPWRAFSLARE